MPWQPHRVRERLEPRKPLDLHEEAGADLSNVIVLIPARDEAPAIGRTLASLVRQGSGLTVIVIDDQSSDGTPAEVERVAAANASVTVRVIAGAPLPPGWAGKLWALEQGLAHVDRPYVLLLDADIALDHGVLCALRAMLEARDAVLVSIMAELHCTTFSERLLAPAFVFFFKLLYPFALVNDERGRVAAAAGGCMFLRTDALRAAGGFAALRGALIDDCTLAAALKRHGRIWLGLSQAVRSHRRYDLGSFWRMVSRSAFTQLRYSTALLLATTAAMLVFFVVPIAALVAAPRPAAASSAVWLSCAALLAASAAYWPIVRFYRLPVLWTLTLPLAACLFLGMTWDSAVRYWRGTRATWKSRNYERTGVAARTGRETAERQADPASVLPPPPAAAHHERDQPRAEQ